MSLGHFSYPPIVVITLLWRFPLCEQSINHWPMLCPSLPVVPRSCSLLEIMILGNSWIYLDSVFSLKGFWSCEKLIFPKSLCSCARCISPTRGGNLSVTLSYFPFFPPHWRVKLSSSKFYHKGDRREIVKTKEDVCCHVSLIPTSTLESRDEIPVRGVEV